MRWLKRLFCSHSYQWSNNIYGDAIMVLNARSVWACSKCGKQQLRPELGGVVRTVPKKARDGRKLNTYYKRRKNKRKGQ